MTNPETISWTLAFIDWVPWIDVVGDTGISPEQRAYIDDTLGERKGSIYYETLANDIESVKTRTALFSDIFESEGGTPRTDRELAATATSRINGCVYCASVHARLYGNDSERRPRAQRLLDEGIQASLPERERAIVDFSEKLTVSPESLSPEDLRPLRDLGFDDLDILDLVQSAAIFANANRLMLSLGEPARQRD